VCFQAFHSKLIDTDGEEEANIDRDRCEADIVVGGRQTTDSGQTFADTIGEALAAAKNGDKESIS
jgi:hypothetical protein